MLFKSKFSVFVLLGCCIMSMTDAHTISNKHQCFLPNAKESVCKPLAECPTLVEAVERNKAESKMERTQDELVNYRCTHEPEKKEFCCPDFVVKNQEPDQVVFVKDPNPNAPGVLESTRNNLTETAAPAPAVTETIILETNVVTETSVQIADKSSQPDESASPAVVASSPQFASYQNKDCGKFADVNKKIYPWTIVVKNKQSSIPCFGSIISDKFVLTTASCLKDLETVIKFAHNGDCGPVNSTECLQIVLNVEKVISNDAFDVGLIKLTEPLKFDQNTNSICLITGENFNKIQSYGSVNYWYKYDTSFLYNSTEIELLEDVKCKEKFAAVNDDFSSQHICTEFKIPVGFPDNKFYFTGSPLQFKLDDSTFYQMGVGLHKSNINTPMKFLAVKNVLGWIETELTK